jgi:hypothetical protein
MQKKKRRRKSRRKKKKFIHLQENEWNWRPSC